LTSLAGCFGIAAKKTPEASLCACNLTLHKLTLLLQLFSGYSGTCPPVLCKMRASIVAACQVYQNTPGIVGPGSRVIHGDYSTDVGVAWDAANTTGLIAFRGSQVWAVGYTLSRL